MADITLEADLTNGASTMSYNFWMPNRSRVYQVGDFNRNWNLLDSLLRGVENAVDAQNQSITGIHNTALDARSIASNAFTATTEILETVQTLIERIDNLTVGGGGGCDCDIDGAISAHNLDMSAHADIRALIENVTGGGQGGNSRQAMLIFDGDFWPFIANDGNVVLRQLGYSRIYEKGQNGEMSLLWYASDNNYGNDTKFYMAEGEAIIGRVVNGAPTLINTGVADFVLQPNDILICARMEVTAIGNGDLPGRVLLGNGQILHNTRARLKGGIADAFWEPEHGARQYWGEGSASYRPVMGCKAASYILDGSHNSGLSSSEVTSMLGNREGHFLTLCPASTASTFLRAYYSSDNYVYMGKNTWSEIGLNIRNYDRREQANGDIVFTVGGTTSAVRIKYPHANGVNSVLSFSEDNMHATDRKGAYISRRARTDTEDPLPSMEIYQGLRLCHLPFYMADEYPTYDTLAYNGATASYVITTVKAFVHIKGKIVRTPGAPLPTVDLSNVSNYTITGSEYTILSVEPEVLAGKVSKNGTILTFDVPSPQGQMAYAIMIAIHQPLPQ